MYISEIYVIIWIRKSGAGLFRALPDERTAFLRKEMCRMNLTKSPVPGSLKISGNAILKIAQTAAAEAAGAVLAVPKARLPFAACFSPPVKVRFSADSVVIDVSIAVMQGFQAHTVAETVQENVKSAVQNMTGIAVSKVNVKITGIQPARTE